jgi:hypothetical protein
MTNRKLIGLVGAMAIAFACGAPEPKEIAGWGVSDETSTATIDQSPWQEILDGYVGADDSGVNLFDYEAISSNAADTAKLDDYLGFLRGLDPSAYSRAEQMAYWINLYNAVTVRVVLGGYPVESVREIHEGLVPLVGPWGDVHANVAGQDLTLDDIEHRILRPIWKDPRIHYAVNCAAYGCPHLATTAFTADNLEELLDQGARDYVNHLRGVDVLDEAFAVVSSIYPDDWYREDFGVTVADVIAHFLQYADAELAEQLRGFDGIMEYDYDWRLNEPPATPTEP